MGYSFPARVVFVLSLLGEAASFATPQLQLSQTAVFAAAPAQTQTVVGTVLAVNTGDGDLNLSFSSSVPWLTASIGGSSRGCRNYPNSSQCFGIRLTVDTANLPNGVVTGSVNLSSPYAQNVPQNIVVTIVVGGPAGVNIYVPPTGAPASVTIGTDTTTFDVSLYQPVNPNVQLTLVVPTLGTYPFTTQDYDFVLQATAASGTPDAVYQAAYSITGLASAAENASVPVYIHVTKRPVATPSATGLNFSSSSGAAPQSQQITFSNSGLGTLQINAAKVDSSWLSATVNPGNSVVISVYPSGVLPGSYTGSVTVTGNAANPVVIPVTLTITGLGPPVVTGISGETTPTLPLGEFVTIVGSNFTVYAAQTADPAQVLPTSIDGTSVLLGTEAAPLLSVAYGSITFQVPYDVSASYLEVVREGGATSNPFQIQIVPCAPVLTSVVDANGVRLDSNASNNDTPPVVNPGSPITIFGHGFGQTNPPAPSGTPIPAASIFGSPALEVPTQVQFYVGSGAPFRTMNEEAQLIPGLIGAYQVAASAPQPPSSAGKPASVNLAVKECGQTSNALSIRVR